MEKRIAIIFGGSFGIYSGVFKEIDKKFDCKIMRTSPFRLKVRINKIEVKFYICNSPIRDKNYHLQKRWLQSSQWKELMPPPANEVVKAVDKPQIVLFFGYCGTFKGKKSVYAPETFKEIFFKEKSIMDIDELNMTTKNKIKINPDKIEILAIPKFVNFFSLKKKFKMIPKLYENRDKLFSEMIRKGIRAEKYWTPIFPGNYPNANRQSR